VLEPMGEQGRAIDRLYVAIEHRIEGLVEGLAVEPPSPSGLGLGHRAIAPQGEQACDPEPAGEPAPPPAYGHPSIVTHEPAVVHPPI
jgi:hypothetical protein